MKFVLMVYHGPNPTLPGSDRWKALPEAEQKAIYADYAELNKTEGMTGGLPLGLPQSAKTVQVRDGKTQVTNGTYLAEGAGGYTVYEAESMLEMPYGFISRFSLLDGTSTPTSTPSCDT